MKQLVGRDNNGNLAVADGHTRGIWDKVEQVGSLYSILSGEDVERLIIEAEYDDALQARLDALGI